jgi:hypothetical protein
MKQKSFCSVEGIHKSTCADIFFGIYSQNFNNVGLKLLAKKIPESLGAQKLTKKFPYCGKLQ